MLFSKLHTSAREPCVWIRVDKQLHLEQISDLLRVEHEDALEQHHISRVHRDELLFPGTTQTWKRFPHVRQRSSYIFTPLVNG